MDSPFVWTFGRTYRRPVFFMIHCPTALKFLNSFFLGPECVCYLFPFRTKHMKKKKISNFMFSLYCPQCVESFFIWTKSKPFSPFKVELAFFLSQCMLHSDRTNQFRKKSIVKAENRDFFQIENSSLSLESVAEGEKFIWLFRLQIESNICWLVNWKSSLFQFFLFLV